MPEYKAEFSLEDERKASEELINHLRQIWRDRDVFQKLQTENSQVRTYIWKGVSLINRGICLGDNKEFGELGNEIMKEIWADPILNSITIYNSIEPENLPARAWIRNLLTEEKISPYYDLLKIDLLKGSGLVKDFSGVPMFRFMVG